MAVELGTGVLVAVWLGVTEGAGVDVEDGCGVLVEVPLGVGLGFGVKVAVLTDWVVNVTVGVAVRVGTRVRMNVVMMFRSVVSTSPSWSTSAFPHPGVVCGSLPKHMPAIARSSTVTAPSPFTSGETGATARAAADKQATSHTAATRPPHFRTPGLMFIAMLPANTLTGLHVNCQCRPRGRRAERLPHPDRSHPRAAQ